MRFGYVDIGFGETYWYATIASENEPKSPLAVSELPDRFGQFHEAARDYIGATPTGYVFDDGVFDIAPAKQWSSGRVVLLGDAIHPTTPNMGQGAGMAIESAVVLAAALRRDQGIEESLRLYQQIRKPRTASVTQGSRRIGGVTSWSQGLACGLRDWSMRLTPKKVFERQLSRFAVQDFSGGLVLLPRSSSLDVP
jgi:2-polyprenyl-6-methoxyphenol hydroxylase-like FAD-dependent oxidoreductase